jgi:signal transduction histidine kinase
MTNKGNRPLVRQTQSPLRLRSRAALLAAFGALLALMAIICVDGMNTLVAFDSSNRKIRQEFLYREQTLDRVRAGLYQSGNMLRDYILAGRGDSGARNSLQMELASIQHETSAVLRSCLQSLPEDKRKPFQHLDTELETYWSNVMADIGSEPTEKITPRSLVLRDDVLSQHASVLKITEEISAVNNDDLQESEQRIAEDAARFRRRFLTFTAITLSLGFFLTVATIIYTSRLENSLEENYLKTLKAERELKELSKRLVDTEERERRALSRELHDEVGQSLGALLLEVEHLAEISRETAAHASVLQNIKKLAENCVNEVRNMTLLLRPSMLDDLGLVAALEWQAREVSRRTGIVIDTVDEGVSYTLPDEHRTCVYRVVQEALNNCAKHADAKRVRIVVHQEPKWLRVSIEDDGKGFDPSRTLGLGLIGMRERISQLGGVLEVGSDPERGTRLRVELPLPVSSTT